MGVKPGYKQTEVGVIQEDWDIKKIGDKIDLLTGFPFPSNKYTSSGIKLLRGSNIKRGKTDWADDITQYWKKVTFDLQQYVLNEGDIVIAMDGFLVGRSFARLSKNDLPALLLQRVARIRSKKIDMGYLKEWICGDKFTKHCDSVKTVTAIPHISPEDIRSFAIPLPPTLAEQSAIATALSDTDTLIQSLERLITKKRDIKQGVMQELLTGKKRLPGFEKKKGYKQTEIGVIPEDWEIDILGHFVKIRSGESPSKFMILDSGVPYFKVEQLNNSIKYQKQTPYFIDIVNPVKSKSLIFPKRGEAIYQNKIRILAQDSYMDTNLMTITVDPELDYEYLFYFLSKRGLSHIADTTSVPQINNKHIIPFKIVYPKSKLEQNAIATVLSDMDAEIAALDSKLAKARQIKQGMMQELLTGRIRLT